MTFLLVTGFVVVAAAGLIWLLVTIGPFLILRAHNATEAHFDQAPLAHGVLDELAAAAQVARPRLYVLPSAKPNGFVVANKRDRMVAVTEGVFELLNREQLQGLFALLVARLGRPLARAETAIAAISLVLSPLVLPSIALAHFGLPGRRWYEVDRSAATLVGGEAVMAALQGLESARGGEPDLQTSAVSALYCVQPAASKSMLMGARATQPPTADRIAMIGEIAGRPGAGASTARAPFAR